MPSRSKGGPPREGISNPSVDSPHRGKKSVRRAIRAFFLWGRARYRGHLILEYTQLAGLFPALLIQDVRGSVSHLRRYWSAVEGTSTTTEHLIPQLLTYRTEVESTANQHQAMGRSSRIADEEGEALDDQLHRVADPQHPMYTFPLPQPRPPGKRRPLGTN